MERERKRGRQKRRERDEMLKTQKQYYVSNITSAYFHINRRLHSKREYDRERETEG